MNIQQKTKISTKMLLFFTQPQKKITFLQKNAFLVEKRDFGEASWVLPFIFICFLSGLEMEMIELEMEMVGILTISISYPFSISFLAIFRHF